MTRFLPAVLIFLFVSPAFAQNSDEATAQMEVRISALEEELRELRGKIEEDDFQIRKLNDALAKFQKDTDFRFNDLTAKSAAAPAPLPDSVKSSSEKPDESLKTPPARKPLPDESATTGGDGVLRIPETEGESADAAPKTSFANPREHYNYAFRLLNQTQYDAAAKSFDAFTKKYPKDPLAGNAFYWEGETYYIRHDYVNAADNFRQGFEAMPDGPKAADNLLKLAMSLDALNRDKEACVVLQQITTKYKKSSSTVAGKADQEQKRIGCQ